MCVTEFFWKTQVKTKLGDKLGIRIHRIYCSRHRKSLYSLRVLWARGYRSVFVRILGGPIHYCAMTRTYGCLTLHLHSEYKRILSRLIFGFKKIQISLCFESLIPFKAGKSLRLFSKRRSPRRRGRV